MKQFNAASLALFSVAAAMNKAELVDAIASNVDSVQFGDPSVASLFAPAVGDFNSSRSNRS